MSGQASLSFARFAKDAYIIVEGKRDADHFFIIREGKVRISREAQVVAEEQGDTLGPGDFFGVVATMSGNSHIESAQALTDVTVILVQRDQFTQLIQNTAPVAMKIILQFSKRVRYLNEALTRLTLKKNAEADVNHLFTIGEYYFKQSQFNQAYYAYSQYMKYCPKGENVQAAKARLAKASIYAKSVKLRFDPNEMVREYPKDTMIFSEGEPGEELYVIKSGSVKIAKIVEKNEVLLAVLKAGDIFGEMALLESKPRTACAAAYEECQLMVINRVNFGEMIKTQPQLIARLTTLLAERIWSSYKQLANTQIRDHVGRMYDMLLMHLEKKRVNFNVKSPIVFDFGTKELIHMIGLSAGDGDVAIGKLLQNKCIQVTSNKITVTDPGEILRQTASSRKLQEIENRRKS
jgi:CRP-like cAMP-binding protein